MDRGIPSPMRCPIPSLVRKWCYAASNVPAFRGSRTRRSGPPFVIPAKAGIQSGWGEGNVVRPKATQGESKTSRGEGLVPRWGGGGAW